MRIDSIRLSGFRCFGPAPITVGLAGNVTSFVGPNASGKTALLQALTKLFGVTQDQRTVRRADFHVGALDDPNNREPKYLFIEVLLGFPELLDGTASAETIAPTFRHMLLERPGNCPVCRLRLSAIWEDDGTLEGGMSQELVWVHTLEDKPSEDKLHPVSIGERGLIQVYYTPAIRNPAIQVRATTGALAARLLRAIDWSSDTKVAVEKASEEFKSAFANEAATVTISNAIRASWSLLHDEAVDTNPRLSLISRDFEETVSKITVVFEDSPDGRERSLEALSDGQQSLFYFALAAAVFDLERHIVDSSAEGFQDGILRIPALTLFAVEEPENHLSPYYLARIVNQLRALAASGGAQVLLTSHSSGVLSRVEPIEARFCYRDRSTRVSKVRPLEMPKDRNETAKYVRGAVLAFPELYFARFVLLVEGDSEQIALPKLAEALGVVLDPSFVAIVPLGGRHVEHFWRLLKSLNIPYATLLDLDLGRSGGGFGRIKTALGKLIEFGVSRNELLTLQDGTVMSDASFESMHTWQNSCQTLLSWVNFLEKYGVFFSAPVDLDMMMLEAYPGLYNGITPKGGGPRLTVEKARAKVFGENGLGTLDFGGNYSDVSSLLPAYNYHFKTNSKPATHLEALSLADNATIKATMPSVLFRLIVLIREQLKLG